ncbi:MAG: hypothetical protein AABX89_03680 [Candidatus Thermoplasmatota archaeon]
MPLASPASNKPTAAAAAPAKKARKVTPKKPVKQGVRKSPAKKSEGAALVAAELEQLSAHWRQSLLAHKLHTEARFLELRKAVSGKGAKMSLNAKEAAKVRAVLRGVKLKPKKGRVRDLRAVDEALKSVLRRVES